jgi:hypothetical protein
MAFTGNFMCTSFKKELLEAKHNFLATGGHQFKLALYDNNASFDADTQAYTSTNEVGNTGTYSAGGGNLTNVNPTTSGTTAFTDFDAAADLEFTDATITAYGALIYNSTTSGDPAVLVLDFDGAKTSTNGTFKIIMPTDDANSAIIRIETPAAP